MKYLILGPCAMGIFSMVGTLKKIESQLESIEEISGSSAGSLIGLLLILGKSIDEILDILLKIDVPSLTKLNLNWSRNNDNDFHSYRIFRSNATGVDSTSHLVTTITNQNSTSYQDTDLEEDTNYYYRIYVYDTGNLASGSNERMGKTFDA